MGRRRAALITVKWEKALQCRPNHNIISSDFPKYIPHPWKFMDGPSYMSLLLANEYQRLWRTERDAWSKRMYPEKAKDVDIVKRYVQNFSKYVKKQTKPEKSKPFRMKQFDKIAGKMNTRRAPDDKAMRKKENKTKVEKSDVK